MNESNGVVCPVVSPLEPDTYDANIFLFAFAIFSQAVMILHFYWYRNTSVFLRRRPMSLILLSAFGGLSLAFYTMLNSLVLVPCALRGIFEAGTFVRIPKLVN